MTSQLKVDRISPATGSEIIIDGFGGGKILQVVSVYFPLEASVGPNGVLIKTAVKVSITPSSSSSRVLLHMNSGAWTASLDRALVTGFFRDNTLLVGSGGYYRSADMWGPHSTSWLDSPNTTSEVTYTLGVDAEGGGVYYSGFDSTGRALQLIAMEIGE